MNDQPCENLSLLSQELLSEIHRKQATNPAPGSPEYLHAEGNIRYIHELITQHRLTCLTCGGVIEARMARVQTDGRARDARSAFLP
jgi:hypothetical protein